MKEKTRISGHIPYSLAELKKLYRFSRYMKNHEKVSKKDIDCWLIGSLLNYLSELEFDYCENREDRK